MTGLGATRRVLAASALAALALATPAAAQTVTSTNWSGYAAHSGEADFRTVSGTWREPGAICTPGTETESAFWVGLGGYRSSSTAMEQIGTELDCGVDGSASISAWYELVPAASRTIRLTVGAGDVVTARVTVLGRRVTMTLEDVTRGESFRHTIVAASVDTTSAEWIAEAPSDCTSPSECAVATLTDFGAVTFSSATARTTTGIGGDVADPAWTTTRLLLGEATTPSLLASGGRSFTVTYAATTTGPPGPGGPS